MNSCHKSNKYSKPSRPRRRVSRDAGVIHGKNSPSLTSSSPAGKSFFSASEWAIHICSKASRWKSSGSHPSWWRGKSCKTIWPRGKFESWMATGNPPLASLFSLGMESCISISLLPASCSGKLQMATSLQRGLGYGSNGRSIALDPAGSWSAGRTFGMAPSSARETCSAGGGGGSSTAASGSVTALSSATWTTCRSAVFLACLSSHSRARTSQRALCSSK